MKKYILATIMGIVTIIASNQLICSSEPQANQTPKKAEWAQVGKYFVTNILSGGFIGALTGKFSAYALSSVLGPDGQKVKGSEGIGLILFIAILIGEGKLRSKLVDEVNHSFEEYSIPHKASLIHDIAWVASWISWL